MINRAGDGYEMCAENSIEKEDFYHSNTDSIHISHELWQSEECQ